MPPTPKRSTPLKSGRPPLFPPKCRVAGGPLQDRIRTNDNLLECEKVRVKMRESQLRKKSKFSMKYVKREHDAPY
jgi:hypothetical protein